MSPKVVIPFIGMAVSAIPVLGSRSKPGPGGSYRLYLPLVVKPLS